jgi:two-component system, NtrC family, sensor kinase
MGVVDEKADLLDLMFEATNDGVVDWDLVGKQTRYNERWRFLLGWDEEEFRLTPDTWRELVHADERADVEKAIADHLEQEWPFVQTVRMRHRSRGWRWILMRGTSRRNEQGAPTRMVIIFADIDERVRAETQLRALLEAIPDTILRVRVDGTVLAVKEGSRVEHAHLDSDTVSHKVFDAIVSSESGSKVMDAIRCAGKATEAVRIPCHLRSGNVETDYDIRIVHGGIDEAVCIVRDVTRDKTAEEQLSRGKKLQAIGQLATGLAHEINTPLQYIGDNLQFAKDSMAPLLELVGEYHNVVCQEQPIPVETREAVARKEEEIDLSYVRGALAGALAAAQEGLGQIARIVRAMKTFEDVGRQERARVDLNPIVENATVVATHAWKHVAELSMQLEPNLPFAPCVAGEIAQVVVNLVINAAQAIGDKVGHSGRKGRITVETRRGADADSVELRVTDNGIGIPEAIRARVFDPFFTTRTVGQGIGQGLAQVHAAVVNLHGGTVRFDSRIGEGTCFIVSLPLREAGQQAQGGPAQSGSRGDEP